MSLLVDMGNTRLKWAVLHESKLVAGRALVNQHLTRHELLQAWNLPTPPKRLAIACVSATPLLELVRTVAVGRWPAIEIIEVKSKARAFGVHNAYQQPEKLGVDRWLALIAARNFYQGHACIVDCGTAITVDLIDADGQHQGGLISPGLTLMKKSLAEGTEALQFQETSHDAGLANYTEAAIYNGTLAAAAGLIEHVLARQANVPQVILTGGDAGVIAARLSIKPVIDADLVLRGLAVVLENQQ
jgi:type III pantothenate kinase